jgi:hypothetical protein
MARITFQKRQKEMKRQEKQRMKAERRAQRKIEKSLHAPSASSPDHSEIAPDDPDASSHSLTGSDSLAE